MFAGCVFLWVGVPLLWLWIGSQLQNEVELGTALAVMMIGAVSTIICLAPVLAWLNRRHVELRAARGHPVGESSPLEVMLVVSAVLALIGFVIWFLGFSGSSPIPLDVSY
jgi:hypothetical protein